MISIILPVFNEAENLNELYTRLNAVCLRLKQKYELIFVNNGSVDGSLDLLKSFKKRDRNVKILDFSRNFGHQGAITAGMEFAKGDSVVIMDADLQDPPEMIPDFIEKTKQGYDVVYGIRVKREGETLFKKVACKMFYKILSKITDVDVPLDSGDFRLYSRRAVDQLNSLKEKRRYIRGLSSWIGFKQIGIEYVRPPRYAGETKYSFHDLFSFAWEGVTSLSTKPLRLATYCGMMFAFASFVYMSRILYLRLIVKEFPEGWTSMMVIILFLGGIQLLCLGVIGEYIGRIAEETRNRHVYIIKDVYDD